LSPESKATAPPAEPTVPAARNLFVDFFRKRSVLVAAAMLAGFWILGLAALALFSANPVTINQKQIRQSDFLVTATRDSDEVSTLTVTKEWIQGEQLGTITVTNLGDTKIAVGQEFLVPLQQAVKGRFQVTPTGSLLNEVPLVYPATAEAKSQLQALLESRAK
jgi:hypothetical protein